MLWFWSLFFAVAVRFIVIVLVAASVNASVPVPIVRGIPSCWAFAAVIWSVPFSVPASLRCELILKPFAMIERTVCPPWIVAPLITGLVTSEVLPRTMSRSCP